MKKHSVNIRSVFVVCKGRLIPSISISIILSHKIVFTNLSALVVEIINKHRVPVLVGAFDSSDFNAHPLASSSPECRKPYCLTCVIGLHFGIADQ